MDWNNVQLIRDAQKSARSRFNEEQLLSTERINEAVSAAAKSMIPVPHMTELEQMIFKMRAELIDYIVAHGLVDGLMWDGVLQPIENGKIVITREMVETITDKLGYFTESDVQAFLEMYLPENHYVQDEDYVHTDNNFTTNEKDKLAGIEPGSEVNKVIEVIFNGVATVDPETRIATITITPEDIKQWYESNPDTNAFTDAQKEKLAGIAAGAEVNRVDDVLVDNRSVLDDNKKAKITKEIIKAAYEANPDTNALTDKEKAELAALDGWTAEHPTVVEMGGRIDAAEGAIEKLEEDNVQNKQDIETLKNNTTPEKIKELYESNPDTNSFTDAEKEKLEGISSGATVAKVDDVTLDGVTVLDGKIAKLTASDIKKSYESNPDTNAFTNSIKKQILNYKSEGGRVDIIPLPSNKFTVDAQPGIYNASAKVELRFTKSSGDYEELICSFRGIAYVTHEADNRSYVSGILFGHTANTDSSKAIFAIDLSNYKELYVISKGDFGYEVEVVNNEKITFELKNHLEPEEKISDVTLDDSSVVENKVAKLTASDIKKSYESNPDTNAFTDAEKEKLSSIGTPVYSGQWNRDTFQIPVPNFSEPIRIEFRDHLFSSGFRIFTVTALFDSYFTGQSLPDTAQFSLYVPKSELGHFKYLTEDKLFANTDLTTAVGSAYALKNNSPTTSAMVHLEITVNPYVMEEPDFEGIRLTFWFSHAKFPEELKVQTNDRIFAQINPLCIPHYM